jgi:hypothetical protein
MQDQNEIRPTTLSLIHKTNFDENTFGDETNMRAGGRTQSCHNAFRISPLSGASTGKRNELSVMHRTMPLQLPRLYCVQWKDEVG